ncbi:MAG: TonB-dependent receptor plug domain-containing protein [Alphaproteobacteria bacterium]|nr:TonB-dependent receptor plug domain-containing protein [Alphaproteobacteria bacterium]
MDERLAKMKTARSGPKGELSMSGTTGGRLAASRAFWGRAVLAGGVALAFVAVDMPAVHAQLETITVSARKRGEENVRNIPVAVDTISPEKVAHFSITNLQEVADISPSLKIARTESGSGASISIRGYGSPSTSIGIEQSVAVVVDGVYYGQGRVINEGMFDTRQVAVLKGPQALFFGKNATAGVISIETNDPGDDFELLARVGYEFRTKDLKAEAIVSGPVNDKFGIRLAVKSSNMFGGFFKNTAGPGTYTTVDAATGEAHVHDVGVTDWRKWPGEKDLFARLTLQAKPTDRLTLTLKPDVATYGSRSMTHGTEARLCPLGGVSQLSGNVCNPNWSGGSNPFPQDIAETNPLVNYKGGKTFTDYFRWGLTGTVDYTTDTFSWNTVLNYHRMRNRWANDNDLTETPAVWAAERYTFRAFSAESRVATTFDDPFNFVLGVYYQTTRNRFDQDVLFAGAENSAVEDPTDRYTAYEKASATKGSTYSVYGQVIWKFLENWELTGGARYLHETKNSFFTQPYVNPFFLGIFAEGTVNADQSFNNVSPEVTLTWHPTDTVTIYGAYKQGFKSGGFSNSGILGVYSTVDDFAFEPEDVEGFEGGIKTSLLDDTLRLDLNAYTYRIKNLQIDFFNSPTFAFITTNAGKSKTEGVELNVDWAPKSAPGLRMHTSMAYNNARYKDFIGPCWAGQRPSEGCDMVGPAPASVPQQDLSGKPRSMAPKFVVGLGADYEVDLGQGLLLGLSMDAQYSSKYWATVFANPYDIQGDYVLLNAAVRLGGDDDSWQVAVIGKNLTNHYVFYPGLDLPLTGGNTGCSGVGDPRASCAGAGYPADQGNSTNMPRTVEIQFTYRY